MGVVLDILNPMKNQLSRLLIICGLGFSTVLTSCVGPYAGPNQRVGSVIGGATGAVAGAVIGNQSGRPLEGAAIGGAIGALAGAAIGGANDQAYYDEAGYAPVPAPVVVRPYPRYGYYGRPYAYRRW